MQEVQTIQTYYYLGIVAMLLGSILIIGGLERVCQKSLKPKSYAG
jgi:hypothetical protein